MFLVESETTEEMFAKLKSIGVRLALDDFGTGYSSLGYLKKTPFDKIKIDQSFVRGAAKKDSRNAAIIRAIVTLADSLGMDTTAEGAETHDELDLIRELGCSHIQGYIFGRPMNAEEAGELAAQNKVVEADGFQFNRPARQGLLKVASLQWNGMQMPVRVRNISTGGALLECDRTLPAGEKVQLDIPGAGNLGADIRWSESSPHGPPVRGRIRPSPADDRQEHRLRRQARLGPLHAPQIFRGFGRQVAAQVRRPALLSEGPDPVPPQRLNSATLVAMAHQAIAGPSIRGGMRAWPETGCRS